MCEHPSHDLTRFKELLVRSRLVAQDEYDSLAAKFRDEYLQLWRVPKTITSFCSFLVAVGVLTTWQVGKLREGRFKGFYLDDFVLLDTLGRDDYYRYFLARNTRDNSYVRLAITPPHRTKGPQIEYHVDHRFEC